MENQVKFKLADYRELNEKNKHQLIDELNKLNFTRGS